ncbi:hypothetical protein H6503_05560 [Candidatus Woesearchaeota archaeon]|nr:hypothetical protein [Candidatus Woesearchaeota archaeon]
MRRIITFDTTNRDGEQALGHAMLYGEKSKMIIAKALAEMNVDIIEAGFPISSPKDYEAVKMIAQQIHGPRIAALARIINRDIDRAWDAVKGNPNPYVHEFSILINKEALKAYEKGIEGVMEHSVKATQYARSIMGHKPDLQFSAQGSLYAIVEAINSNDGHALEGIKRLHDKVIAAGANIINLPDTEGKCIPKESGEAIRWFRSEVKGGNDIELHVHCHNDLGNAVANSFEALISGADCAETTVNGIGERSGNAAFEEVVMNVYAIGSRYGIFTDVDTKRLTPISDLVEEHTGEAKAPGKAIVGKKAFQHSSGIHQDGNEKGNKKGVIVYQAGFTADKVGWIGEESRMTAKAGKHGVATRVNKLGFNYSVEKVEKDIMPLYESCADTRQEVTDMDLRAIINEAYSSKDRVNYVAHSIDKPFHSETYSGDVILKVDDKEVTSVVIDRERDNVGGIDAVFNAVDSVMPFEVPRLVIYDPRNIGEKHDTVAEVTIVLSGNGFEGNFHKDQPLYIGRARSIDTIEASVKAYIAAINDYCRRVK